MDHQWKFRGRGGGGRGVKMPKIPKGRGCLYEIIFPEGHERLAIIIYVQRTYI